MAVRLPILRRQAKTFELVVEGKTHEQIAKRLKISEDTVERDMEAIADMVRQLVRNEVDQVLAVAIATYMDVIDQARAEYARDLKRENDWYAGRLDYPTLERSVKTLEAPTPPTDDDGLGVIGSFINDLADADDPKPAEIVTKTSAVRPPFRSQRATWLKLIVDTTRELTELCGLKKLVIEQRGTVNHNHTFTLDDWRREAQARRTTAEHTLTLLPEEDDA